VILLPPGNVISALLHFCTSELLIRRRVATSRPHDLTTSRPHDLTTSRPHDLTTSRPHDLPFAPPPHHIPRICSTLRHPCAFIALRWPFIHPHRFDPLSPLPNTTSPPQSSTTTPQNNRPRHSPRPRSARANRRWQTRSGGSACRIRRGGAAGRRDLRVVLARWSGWRRAGV
jgi:hypothetical protein